LRSCWALCLALMVARESSWPISLKRSDAYGTDYSGVLSSLAITSANMILNAIEMPVACRYRFKVSA
jgi:hypothetical protein